MELRELIRLREFFCDMILGENVYPGKVSLRIYNMPGQLVTTVVNEYQEEGYYEAVWTGRNESGSTVSSGIYLYRFVTEDHVETRKMTLMK